MAGLTRTPASALAALLVAVLIGCSSDDPAAPPVGSGESTTSATPGQTPVLDAPAPAEQARCAAPTAAFLAENADLAFAGTVESVGEQVVLIPEEWFVGEESERVVVRPAPEEMRDLVAGVDFAVAQRYLVAAAEGQVMICGYTGPRSGGLRGLYRQAFES